jgi:hypothetical protein
MEDIPLERDESNINSEKYFWYDLIEENEELKNDFQKLYEAWKELRTYGLSFDIYSGGNMTIVKDLETGELRLKVFDAIPLFLIDEWSYGSAFLKGVPEDLIVLKDSEWGDGYNESEDFFHELEEHFQPKN